jgi:hypothetical protein
MVHGNDSEREVQRLGRPAGVFGIGLLCVAAAGCAHMPVNPPATPPKAQAPGAPATAPAGSAPAAAAAARVAASAPLPPAAPQKPVAAAARKPAATSASAAKPAVAASAAPKPTAAPAPPAPPPAAAAPALDLASLEQRLRDTKAIGVFTKLSLKNQVDDLLRRFRDFYGKKGTVTLAELRQKYDLLLLKVLSVLQDGDPALAAMISASREAIWGILADPVRFSKLQT